MKYAVLDLETTGHSADDEILQAGVVIVSEELDIVEVFSSFVKPTIPIPSFIQQLTGIDEAVVAEAPELDEVLPQLMPLLDGAVLVAHNVGFDAGFLNQALDGCGYMPFAGRRLDTMELLRVLYPSIAAYQLGAAAEWLGISHGREHRADSDAMATALIFIEAVKKLRSMPLLTLQRLSALIDESRDMGWFLGKELQRAEQQQVFEPNGVDYYRQLALKAGEWGDQHQGTARPEASLLDDLAFEPYLEQVAERFAQKFAQYETRESQTEMFREVFHSLSNDQHLLIEAGTGTGKSLGYLIPALYYGVQSGGKIVVSTHTINLQEQLRHRDLPLLGEVLPFPFKATVFKGRSNYLCLRKFETKINIKDSAAPLDDAITAAQMVVWLGETETGDQEELNFGSRGAEFWGAVASDADSCLNRACPWFKRCYYHRAKFEAGTADLCITNHALLFTDLQADHRLLPAYQHLIIDEAHHIEETAAKHLGMNVGHYLLGQAGARLYKDSRSGLLSALRLRLGQEDEERREQWQETIDLLASNWGTIREYWDTLFGLLYESLSQGAEASGDNGGMTARLRGDQLPAHWGAVVEAEHNVHVELGDFLRTAEKLASEVKERIDELAVQAIVTDLNGILRDLAVMKEELKVFVKLDKPDCVFWIEGNQGNRHRSIHLLSAPIDVSSQLQKLLFDAKDSIIMTSATLTVQKSFQYAEEQLGLQGYREQGRLRTIQLASPFQYRKQALVIVPRDFPVLKGAAYGERYLTKLVQSIAEAAEETKGRMLVLFTSYKMLKQTYEMLKERLEETGIGVIGQGIDGGNRTKLTRRFLQQPASVLLGTSSFWEGVDIPGEALTCLAIVRLPFQPPNHPLTEAKSELLQEQNQNPFMKLSIPQAVIRFKQGFGRLVRTARDKGIVILYDTRVIDAYYGKHFLYSLPGPKIETMHTDQMVARMREWLMDDGNASLHGQAEAAEEEQRI